MKLFAGHTILPALAMLLASVASHAQEPVSIQATQAEVPCHVLMTERECAAFRNTLATLPNGKARDHFLAEHTALIHERERLCSCARAKADTVIYYPSVKQLPLRS